jgi:hypothetical protein
VIHAQGARHGGKLDAAAQAIADELMEAGNSGARSWGRSAVPPDAARVRHQRVGVAGADADPGADPAGGGRRATAGHAHGVGQGHEDVAGGRDRVPPLRKARKRRARTTITYLQSTVVCNRIATLVIKAKRA